MKSQTLINDSQNLERLIRDRNSTKRISFQARVNSLRYRLWLLAIRETSLIITLIPLYDKIPKKTPTRLIVGLFVKSSKMKNLLYKVEKKLRNNIY